MEDSRRGTTWIQSEEGGPLSAIASREQDHEQLYRLSTSSTTAIECAAAWMILKPGNIRWSPPHLTLYLSERLRINCGILGSPAQSCPGIGKHAQRSISSERCQESTSTLFLAVVDLRAALCLQKQQEKRPARSERQNTDSGCSCTINDIRIRFT